MKNEPEIDPYQPPRAVVESEGEMPSIQRKLLLEYLEYRREPPTFVGLLPRFMLRWFFVVATSIGVMMLFSLLGAALTVQNVIAGWLMWVMGGFVAGAFFTNVLMLRRFVAMWPYMSAYFDYEKMERDLSAHSSNAGVD